MPMQEIKIYTTPTCAYCKMAKEYMKEKGVDFKEYNVAQVWVIPSDQTSRSCASTSQAILQTSNHDQSGNNNGDPMQDGMDDVRFYSSRGPTNDGRMKPELVAPDGVSITGSGGFPVPFFGTSAAAPHAAGVAALLLDADPSLSPSQISNVLQNTAVDLGSPGPDNSFGFGRIDAFAAVQNVLDSGGGDGFDPGDANQDGMTTSADITCVIFGIFGMFCPMPDCNQDGSVTSADITCVILAIFNQ